ncbi:hypothetical protein LTR56_008856 [Elasticomyces elasticus]|nr:hypothetical protein LTR22_015848 [Elasticomyces elasticus]KAK3645978.1 hypothetical protein LTR56_008856 [Elasticomyces elasticus]KAK4914846.1 hypothetical protein LTR49_016958 [Elasticomyces elasticus]
MTDHTPAEDHGEVVGAATKVFAIPELLEMILQHLHLQHPLQLFTLRRVNSTFHAVITASKARRVYFLIRTPVSKTGSAPALRRNLSFDYNLKKACYPLVWVVSMSFNYATFASQWRGDSAYDPRISLSLLMTQPMNAKASWRDIILAEDEVEVGMHIPCPMYGARWHTVAMEKSVTVGWFVDCYMAQLQQIAAKLYVVGGVNA